MGCMESKNNSVSRKPNTSTTHKQNTSTTHKQNTSTRLPTPQEKENMANIHQLRAQKNSRYKDTRSRARAVPRNDRDSNIGNDWMT